MKITEQLLTKLKACQHGFEILKKYPDGATIVELANDPDVTLEDYFFARHYFHFTEEELQLYNKRCNLKHCGGHVLQSFNVTDSNWIYKSHDIQNSNYISNCNDIKNSSEIKSAINVLNSQDIVNSKNIQYSTKVCDSENIFNSDNIINSHQINWSKIITSSSNLEECQFCYKSRTLNNCYFCGFVDNSENCIFCNNISNAQYQVFNQPVSLNEFEQIKELLLLHLETETVNLLQVNEKRHLDARFSYDLRFDRMFEQLSEDFYGWVGSLPQYDEQIFLLLFFTTLK